MDRREFAKVTISGVAALALPWRVVCAEPAEAESIDWGFAPDAYDRLKSHRFNSPWLMACKVRILAREIVDVDSFCDQIMRPSPKIRETMLSDQIMRAEYVLPIGVKSDPNRIEWRFPDINVIRPQQIFGQQLFDPHGRFLAARDYRSEQQIIYAYPADVFRLTYTVLIGDAPKLHH